MVAHLTPSNFSDIHHPVGSGPHSIFHELASKREGTCFFVSSSSSCPSSPLLSSPLSLFLRRVLLRVLVGFFFFGSSVLLSSSSSSFAFFLLDVLDTGLLFLVDEAWTPSGFLNFRWASSYASPRIARICLQDRALTGAFNCSSP